MQEDFKKFLRQFLAKLAYHRGISDGGYRFVLALNCILLAMHIINKGNQVMQSTEYYINKCTYVHVARLCLGLCVLQAQF